jgi:hypothetical protein
MLAFVTGTVEQELLVRNEYLVTENRILSQLKGRLRLSEPVPAAAVVPENSVLADSRMRQNQGIIRCDACNPPSAWNVYRQPVQVAAPAIGAIDFCVVQTLTFECLFAVVGHGRRQLLWFAVTRHPTAEWRAQQNVEAFPWGTAPTYLVRDNDGAYGQAFTSRVRAMGIRDRPISPRSPLC